MSFYQTISTLKNLNCADELRWEGTYPQIRRIGFCEKIGRFITWLLGYKSVPFCPSDTTLKKLQALIQEADKHTSVSYRQTVERLRSYLQVHAQKPSPNFSLSTTEWLNDNIINAYMELLDKQKTVRCHFFSTYFLTKLENSGYDGVKRWTKNLDLSTVDKIIVPVHKGNHWCLAVINLHDMRFEYYDSFGQDGNKWLALLSDWLKNEYREKKGMAIEPSNWQKYTPKDIPKQTNGFDCGVFICQYAKAISLGKPFAFTQSDMPAIRSQMHSELLL